MRGGKEEEEKPFSKEVDLLVWRLTSSLRLLQAGGGRATISNLQTLLNIKEARHIRLPFNSRPIYIFKKKEKKKGEIKISGKKKNGLCYLIAHKRERYAYVKICTYVFKFME
jgi:hypothetical protein